MAGMNILKWEEIRNRYPNQWVLVEALEAISQNGKREILYMAIINQYNNSTDA